MGRWRRKKWANGPAEGVGESLSLYMALIVADSCTLRKVKGLFDVERK